MPEKKTEPTREFLFSYRFDGKEWGTSVFAASPDEAREKIKAVGMARYDGELALRIPDIVPGTGLMIRAITWWKNRVRQ